MSSDLKAALVHAGQLAVAVFGTVVLEPVATGWFPDARSWLVLACLAVISALIVEFVTLAIIGRPVLHLHWYLEQDPVPLAEIHAHMPTSLGYTVRATLSGGSWLTRLAVRRLVKSDAVLSIRFPSSPAQIVIDRAPRTPDGSRMRAIPNDGNGFDLELANTTRPTSTWTWADIRFETSTPGQSGLPIDTIYECSGSGFLTNFSAKVLVVKSDVKIVRFRSV